MKRTGWGAALLLTLMLGVAPAEAATTYTVSGTSDPPGATCTGTACASLRAAVTNLPSGATIQLGSGIYKLNGVLQIGQTETIVGLSPAQTTIQQTKSGDGVIEASAGDLSLSQLTITGGTKLGHSGVDQHAGGIFQAGSSLTLDHVSVTGNKATGSTLSGTDGGDAVGGIQIDGSATTLTISGSSITNNTATGGTGADAVGSGSGRGAGRPTGRSPTSPRHRQSPIRSSRRTRRPAVAAVRGTDSPGSAAACPASPTERSPSSRSRSTRRP